ncbi:MULTISPECIES: hypothetical protein [Cytophagales]|uniref:Uncharacterized protein n=1 Tax=Marinoscillum luteum TaxID=861051 RepID=A0ABW7NCV9_9BACT|nr:hypothetical protein [Cyclobacterium lianum]
MGFNLVRERRKTKNGWPEAVERSVMDERPSQPERGTNGGLRAVLRVEQGGQTGKL